MTMMSVLARTVLVSTLFAVSTGHATMAAEASDRPQMPDVKRLISDAFMANLRAISLDDVIQISVKAQNRRRAGLDQAGIEALDTQWRAERKAVDRQPLIARTMSSPASAQLIRVQARSLGLYSEIFVMDNKGLNVGQSSITSDYWQGDEDKFLKTYPVGPDAVFVDAAEWHEETRTWRAQVNMTIADKNEGTPIGAITIEINLSELQRRHGV